MTTTFNNSAVPESINTCMVLVLAQDFLVMLLELVRAGISNNEPNTTMMP